MFNQLSIQTKLLFLLASLITISLLSGVFTSFSVMSANRSLKEQQKIASLQNTVDHLEETIISAHNLLTSFLISGDLTQRDHFETKATSAIPLFEKAKKESEDESLRGKLAEAEKLFLAWRHDLADKQVGYMRSPTTVDMARLLEVSENNAKLWVDLSALFTSITENLSKTTGEKSAELQSTMGATNAASIGGLFLTVFITLGVSAFIIFLVSAPLKNLVNTTNTLVQKNWSVEIGYDNRRDEIGQLAQALRLFRDNGVENEKLVAAQKKEDEKRLERAHKIEKLVEAFLRESSEVTSALENATGKMTESSETMNSIASDTSKLSGDVSLSAQKAGENVSNVAAASEELSASIQEISKQLSNTNKMAREAKTTSTNTVDKMKILEESANKVGSVIEIITSIAEQTNLLALNATIEAARAGDAGKGFAVVAGEVKSLANQTAKATEQVNEQINKIQNDTNEAASFIEKIAEAIERLTENVTAIAAAMEEQTTATHEISRNVTEASSGTKTVVENIKDVRAAADRTQETSHSVHGVAEELAAYSEKLKTSISSFILNIKSA